jgi:DNA-binding response OmpR family regulator
VIEDDLHETHARELSRAARYVGDVSHAEAGCVRLFATAEPNVIILDLRLGQEDGFDLLREIRSRSDVPVIITTVTDATKSIAW